MSENQILHKSLARLEEQKAKVAGDLQGWCEAALQLRPEPGSWSALDVVDHLSRVESGVLGAMRSGIGSARRVTWKESAGAIAVRLVMYSPMRVAVPKGAEVALPDPVPDLAGNLERWDGVRRELTALCDSVSLEQNQCGVFRHPVSGWLTVPQTLGFLSSHLRHHEYQLRRLRQVTAGVRSLTA